MGKIQAFLVGLLLAALFLSAVAVPAQEGTDAEYDLFLSMYGQTVSPAGTPPDWDGDGVVDGGDYVKWLNARQTNIPGNGDGNVVNNSDSGINLPPPTEFTIRCMTPDTGGLQLPADLTEQSLLVASVNGAPFALRAGINNDGSVVIRSIAPFEYGDIVLLRDNTGLEYEFEMRPGWTDYIATGCVRVHPD